MDEKIILVDFDGVIHSYESGWQGIDKILDPPVEGALEWLEEVASSEGFEVVVYSARSRDPQGRHAMRQWISSWQQAKGLPERNYSMPEKKPAAFLTLDDRCIQFKGPGTYPSIEELGNFQPWNKRNV